jgi:hypothetical protein
LWDSIVVSSSCDNRTRENNRKHNFGLGRDCKPITHTGMGAVYTKGANERPPQPAQHQAILPVHAEMGLYLSHLPDDPVNVAGFGRVDFDVLKLM